MAAEGDRIQGEPINDDVEQRLPLMIQRNALGEVVREYWAQASGRVAIRGTDAIRERGSDIVTIIANSPDCPP
jgi:predicted deacylase